MGLRTLGLKRIVAMVEDGNDRSVRVGQRLGMRSGIWYDRPMTIHAMTRTAFNVRVRPAVPADVPELSALANRTWSDAFGKAFTPEDQSADAEARRSESFFTDALRHSVILVAELDGRQVGYTKFGACEIPETNATERDRELHRLYVDTSLHDRGIGRKLLNAALEHPELAGAERVFLSVWQDNARAVHVYTSAGFQAVGVSRYTVGSQELEDLVLMRPRSGPLVPQASMSLP